MDVQEHDAKAWAQFAERVVGLWFRDSSLWAHLVMNVDWSGQGAFPYSDPMKDDAEWIGRRLMSTWVLSREVPPEFEEIVQARALVGALACLQHLVSWSDKSPAREGLSLTDQGRIGVYICAKFLRTLDIPWVDIPKIFLMSSSQLSAFVSDGEILYAGHRRNES